MQFFTNADVRFYWVHEPCHTGYFKGRKFSREELFANCPFFHLVGRAMVVGWGGNTPPIDEALLVSLGGKSLATIYVNDS